MKRKMKSFVAAFAATTILLGTMPSVAWAEGYSVGGGSTSFDKILVVEKDAEVPPVEFTYTIAPSEDCLDSNESGTENNSIFVYNGIGTPTIGTADYSSGNTKTADSRAVKTGSDYDTYVKNVSVSFSGITFTEPGIYRYIITEGTSPHAAIIQDVNKESDEATSLQQKTSAALKRTLDVYVEDDGDGNLVVTDYVMYVGDKEETNPASYNDDSHLTSNDGVSGTPKVNSITTGTDSAANTGGATSEKSDNYINLYETSNLTIGKTVQGNQGSRDKYFKFVITFTGGIEGTKLTVDGDAEETLTNNTATLSEYLNDENDFNLSEFTLGSGTTTVTYYLKSGQDVTIKGIPNSTKYTVTETAEDYTPSVTVDGNSDTDPDDSATTTVTDSNTGITDDTDVEFVNTRLGVLPTGIIMSVAPAVGLVLAGLAAAFAVVLGGKRRKEELEEE